MKKQPIISIIIPIYGVEQYLDKCLNSIKLQGEYDFEVLMVDDGSKDNSKEICKKYEFEDNRFHYFWKENGGVASARNFGIKKAVGKYVWFVDGDDFIESDSIEKIYNIIKSNADIYCFDFLINGTKNHAYDKENFNFFIGTSAPWNKLYKLEIIKDNNLEFINTSFGEDLNFGCKVFMHSKKVEYRNIHIYNYLIREGSLTSRGKKYSYKLDTAITSVKDIIDYYTNNKKFDKYKSEIEYIVINHLLIMYSTKLVYSNKKHFKSKISEVKEIVNKHFSNWENNAYLQRKSKTIKQYLKFVNKKKYYSCKLIVLVATKLKKI